MKQIVWGICLVCLMLALPVRALADDALPTISSNTAMLSTTDNPVASVGRQLPDLTKRENFSSAMQIIILLTVLSLAPAILLMMTSFTRIIIVLSLLRQALGTQQLPPNQMLIGLAMFMTFLIMGPTWQRVNDNAHSAIPQWDGKMTQTQALTECHGARPPVHDRADPSKSTTKTMWICSCSSRISRAPRRGSDVGTIDADPRVHAQRTEDGVSPGLSGFICRF